MTGPLDSMPNLSIIMEGAENIADYWDGDWGITRGVVDAAVLEISALATPASHAEALRRALKPDEMGLTDVDAQSNGLCSRRPARTNG